MKLKMSKSTPDVGVDLEKREINKEKRHGKNLVLEMLGNHLADHLVTL